MSQVATNKCKNPETTPQNFLEQMKAITDSIRNQAFDIFQNRNGGNGSDVDDWLQAERSVLWSPASELVDDKKAFRARIALPGFDAKDIQVSAMPDALVIQADAIHTHEGQAATFASVSFRKGTYSGDFHYPRPSMSIR
jgi:HSP20 family molecular chaperone IbpA